ncbi:MAG: histidine kinase [Bacteroidota bacterium]
MNGNWIKDLPVKYKYLLVAAGVVAAISIGQSYFWFRFMANTSKPTWSPIHIITPVINYSFWALLIPVMYHFMQKYQLDTGLSRKKFWRLLVLGLVFAVFHEVTTSLIFFVPKSVLTGSIDTMTAYFRKPVLIMGFGSRLFEFGVIYFFLLVVDNNRRLKNYRIKLALVQAELAKTQLSALKMQLHPHFLFNTLNTVSSLMEVNVDAAQKMLTRLADLLRKILKEGDKSTVRLSEEIKFIENYLEIEQIRFNDRLKISFDIDPKTANYYVPALLLQPFAENAIKHGFYKQVNDCEINISSELNNSTLKLQVKDNGKGSDAFDDKEATGLGIKNCRERLDKLYGDHYNMEIETSYGQGFSVAISIEEKVLQV